MTYKAKAEQYVREKLPELMEPKAGCRLICKGDAWHEHGIMIRGDKLSNITTGKIEQRDDSWEIIGHPIQLQHWLRVLASTPSLADSMGFVEADYGITNQVIFQFLGRDIGFNLTTGQPATTEDYKAFFEIVGLDTNN